MGGLFLLEFVPPPRFRLLRKLGQGGMGVVHEAFDEERRERVAIKVLQRVSADSIVRFKREFRTLQDLHHPGLVTLGELISEGETWFFTMELIDGSDFVAWVTEPSSDLDTPADVPRPPFGFDERKLRSGLTQLSQGLIALHAAGKVHRDIKPSNVLVTRAGRVVILDFGLATDLSGDAYSSTVTDLDVVGTPAYMAPEQAASKPVGPAGDWYAMGALLYEVLTARPPFSGAPLEILMRKQRDEPTAPSALGIEVPRDLEDLCMHLLRVEPARRPTGEQILRVLGGLASTTTRLAHPSMSSMTAQPVFVGRDGELCELRAAFDTVRSGRPVSVLVRGESGIGKSCLVGRFADMLGEEARDLVVLAGRCYEREAVPYKAFDGVIDALSRYMARLPDLEAQQILPMRPGPLVQVFPVLRRVEAIARMQLLPQGKLDPQEVRSRAFHAMRELFIRLADRHPVLIIVDDLQWADADSIALLAEVMRAPDAPQLLFVATIRSVALEGPVASASAPDIAESLVGDVRVIDLERLDEAQAHELALQLVARVAPGLPVSAQTIAHEAEGHPLFIDEIVRHLFMVGAPATGTLRLDDALWSRISTLDAPERKLVEILAVAGAPLPQEIAAKALGIEGNEFSRLSSYLRVAHLVRTTGVRGSDVIEPYHARIRAAVLAHVSDATRREDHRRIALALETSRSPDAEALAIHWQGAGDARSAAKYMLVAADQATQGLAFERAAQLYQYALAMRSEDAAAPGERDEERALQTKLGDALAKAGSGARAAAAYRDAALGANAAESVDLQRRAAEQLLRNGYFDEGVASMNTVLASIGLSLPERPWRVLLAVLWWRFVLRLRGLEFRAVDPSAIAQRDLTHSDILWSVGFAFNLADVVRAQLIQARGLLFAVRLGDPFRFARTLANEIVISSMNGGRTWTQTQALISRATQLADDTGNPSVIAWTKGTAAAAMYLNGRFRQALETADDAIRVFRETTVGTTWEITTVQLFSLQSLALLGRLKDLASRTPMALREAVDRGDVYAAVTYRLGHPNLVWLIANDVAESRKQVADAMKLWSKKGFDIEHYLEFQALTNIDLYAGDAGAALARSVASFRPMERSLVTRIQAIRFHAWFTRGRAAIALAAESPSRRRELLALARADARRIERERMAYAVPFATLLRACIARVDGDDDRAKNLLVRVAREFDAGDMSMHAVIARRVLGGMLRGDEGRALVLASDAWMKEQTVRDADRFTAIFAPGFAG